jgi:hypothetical protein
VKLSGERLYPRQSYLGNVTGAEELNIEVD